MSKALRSNKRAPKVRPCEWARAELLADLGCYYNGRLSQLDTPLKLNNLLVEERISSGLVALVESSAGLFVRQRINSVQKQILKEPIRARFIKRGDERNCFWTEWTFRDYK